MRARHARQIRYGIERARLVRKLLDGINLDPTTDAAIHLASAVARMTRVETPALERRAYLRTRLRERSRPRKYVERLEVAPGLVVTFPPLHTLRPTAVTTPDLPPAEGEL